MQSLVEWICLYRYSLGILLSLIPTGNAILRHIYTYSPNYQYLGIDDILQALSSFKELVHILAPISDVMDALLTFVGENFHVLLISLSHINRHNNQDNSNANEPPTFPP